MYEHMQIVEENRSWPYEGPKGYRPAFANESQNWENIPEAIQVRHFFDSNGTEYDPDDWVTDVYVPIDRVPVEDCIPEFDDHEDHSECAWLLDAMNGYDYVPDDFDSQTAHYERFGRPALPNEY